MVLSHSLLNLAKMCLEYEEGFRSLEGDCRKLDRFYIPTRYPNGLPDGIPKEHYTEEDARDGIAAAKKIIKSVKPE